MRNVVMMAIGAVAAIAVATLFAQRATRHGDPAASLQPAAARADDLSRQAIAPVRYAMINSLWGETSIAPCVVGAVWGARPAHASFAPQMRLVMRAPLRTAAIPVALEPGGAPVVRVLSIANFRKPPAAGRPARTYGQRYDQALRAA